MNRVHRLKVKVTVQGHGIYPWSSCLLHISWTFWKIFIKLQPNVPLGEKVCWNISSANKTQCQGHFSRSQDFLTLNLVSNSYLLSDFNNFYWTSYKCSPQLNVVPNPWFSFAQSRSRSTFKIMGITLPFCVRSISLEPFERFLLNFAPKVSLSDTVCRPMTLRYTIQYNTIILLFHLMLYETFTKYVH